MTIKNENKLEYISKIILTSVTNGYYPHWKLSFSNVMHRQLSEDILNHISDAVLNGYLEGEVIVDCNNPDKNGWWKIKIQED